MRLGDLCGSETERLTPTDDLIIDYIDISSVSNETKSIIGKQTLQSTEAPSRAQRVLKPNDILVSTVRPNLNAVAVYDGTFENLAVASTGFCVLRCKPGVDHRFVFNVCKSKAFIKAMTEQATGASYPAVNDKIIRAFEVPDLSFDCQEQLTARLDTIQRVIDQRKSQLLALDTLIKARFVEMFGDPKNNINGFPVKPLGKLVTDIIPGWSANGEARQKVGTEKAVLKVSAVTQGYFVPEEHKALPHDMEIKKYIFPHKGDLLFSRANTRELVGATAIIEKDYPDLLLPDKLWRVLFTDEINVYYAKYVLSTETIRRDFSAQSTGTSGSMFNVSTEKFRNIHIPVPPISLQIAFESFVHQIDKSKVVVQKALAETQLLFDSLMQKYFG